MELGEAVQFINYAIEKEDKDIHKAQWNQLLPFMGIGWLKFQAFEDYYDACKGKNLDLRPADEIIQEIEDLHAQQKGG